MSYRAGVSTVLVILFVFAAGCATMETAGHKYIMRGQILEVADNEAYLCVGSRDGAKVGQELAVYRFVRMPTVTSKSPLPIYKRESAGRIKIVEIMDEHYARARVLSGDVKANYVAEMEE
jgi:hypothetical protein